MRQQLMSALPVRCKKCGELFDLSYDFEDVSQERFMQELIKLKKRPSAFFCWDCRSKLKDEKA